MLNRQGVALPSRAAIASARARTLKSGGPRKADLYVVDSEGGPLVIKDFAGKDSWGRLIGRIQVARECRAYRRLQGLAGIPAFVGKIDSHALAVEQVEGKPIAEATARGGDPSRVLASLRGLIDRLHAAGVVHNDLRGRDNVLIRSDGKAFVVDLAGAICLRPGSVGHRLFFRWLAVTDEGAFLKWKSLLAPGDLTADERRFLARFSRRRSLWPFNRKRAV